MVRVCSIGVIQAHSSPTAVTCTSFSRDCKARLSHVYHSSQVSLLLTAGTDSSVPTSQAKLAHHELLERSLPFRKRQSVECDRGGSPYGFEASFFPDSFLDRLEGLWLA